MIELASVSPEVFHYTNFNSFLNIILSNTFQTSPVISTQSEEPLSKGYLYYFSTSRTPTNAYTETLSALGVILKLDGRKLAQKYKAHPIDYWGESFREAKKGLYEQEDRLLLNKSEIPNAISYILEVRIYNPETTKLSQARRDKTFKAIRKLKDRNIPVYIYSDANALKINNKKKASSVLQLMTYLTGSDNKGYDVDFRSARKSGLLDFVALIKTPVNKKKSLPRYANQLVAKYLTGDSYYLKDFLVLLRNDLHNFKTDQKARKDLAFILEFMRKEKLNLKDLVNWLDNKWSQKETS